MDDDDTKRNTRSTPHVPPILAVYQALAEVQSSCERLDAAGRNQDVGDAASAADGASQALMQARAALRRFDEDTPRGEIALAYTATGAAHRRIIDQFAHVASQVQSPGLRRELTRLRIGLALACGGEPPPNP